MTTAQRELRGSLSDVFIPKLLHFINQAEKTGDLTVAGPQHQVEIQFDRGRPVLVSSNYLPGLALKDFLSARGILGQDVLDQASREALDAGRQLGVVLLEKGLVDAHTLFETLNLQVKAKLFRVFSWTEGQYRFRETTEVDPDNQNLSINLPNIIIEGIRDYVHMDKLPVEFRGRKDDALFRRTPESIALEDLRLKAKDARLLKLIDGKRTLRQLVILNGENKKQTYKLFYGLFILGFIAFSEAAPRPAVAKTKAPAASPKPSRPRVHRIDDPGEGYSIQAPDELIAQAMESVERARREAGRPESPAPDVAQDASDLPVEWETEEPVEPMDLSFQPEDGEGAAPDPSALSDDEFAPSFEDDGGQESELGLSPEPLDLDAGTVEVSETEMGNVEPEFGFAAEDGDAPLSMAGESGEVSPGGVEIAETSDRGAIPEDPDEMIKQARYHIDSGNYFEALPLLRGAAGAGGTQPCLQPLLAWTIYNEAGRSSDAYREAETMLAAETLMNRASLRSSSIVRVPQ